MPSALLWESIAIILLILLNGFFAMAEMSLVTARKARLQATAERGSKSARIALKLLETPDSLFSTVQIGITLIGILTGAFGGASVSARISIMLAEFPTIAPYASSLAFGMVIITTTYLTLIFGELLPKKMAFSSPERFACLAAPIMLFVMRVSMPAVWLLSLSSRVASKIFNVREEEQSVTDDDIKGLLAEGVRSGAVLDAERIMSERVFQLGDRRVAAIMTHRTQVQWVDLEDAHDVILKQVASSNVSLLPVCEGDLNNVVGILKAREYLGSFAQGGSLPLTDFLHQPVFIPETAKSLAVLDIFKESPTIHFAIVVDEYGDVQGIITLNDVLEAIVGDIPNLDEEEEPDAVQRADGSWLLDGMLHVDDLSSLTGLHISEHDRYGFETLAGLLLQHLGKMPQIGDIIQINNLHFEIVDMDGRRIDRVLVTIKDMPTKAASAD